MTMSLDQVAAVESVRVKNTSLVSSNLAVALMSAIAVIMFNTLPIFFGAASETLAFNNAKLGSLVSSYFSGHTIMTVVAGLGMRHFNLRLAGMAAALLTAFCFLSVAINHSYQWMMVMLFIAGLGSGTVFVLAMAVLAGSDRPTRTLGLGFFMQPTTGAIVVYICPALITPQWGLDGVVVLFAGLFLIAAALSGVYGRSEVLASTVALKSDNGGDWSFQFKPLIPLLTMTVFFIGMSAVWAFMERIGNAAGFETAFIGAVLMGSLLVGGLASLLVVFLENRIGMRIPIGFACSMIVASLLILAKGGSSQAILFALSMIAFQFAWAIAVNYIAASVAWLDLNGNHAPLIPAFMGVGAILGPTVAGIINSDSFIPSMYLCITTAIMVVLVLVVSPLLKEVCQVES